MAFRLAESAETHFCGGAALWRRGGEIALARTRKKALQRRLEGGGIQALVAAARGAGAGAAVGGAGKKNLDARARKKKPHPPGGVRDRELPALVSAAPSPLSALTLAELHLLLASPGARRVRAGRAGDAFVRQGDVGGAMFVVLRGELEALVKTRGRVDGGRDAPEARKPRVVATYRAGDAFGHRSLVYGARREATVMVASGGGGEKGGGKSGGGKKKKGGETSFTPNDDDAAWVLEISRKAVEPVVRRRPTLADHFARYCLEREARESALEGFGGVEEESALDPGAEEEEGAADGFVVSFGAFAAPRRPHPNAPDAPPRGDASDDRSDQPPGLSARLPTSSARLASLARDAHAWLTSGARPPESLESRDARRVVVSTLAFGSASRDAAAALERVGVFAGLDTRQVLTALREGATVEAHPPGSDVGRQPWDHLGRGRGIHDDDQIDEAREREMSGALERCVVVLEGACEVFEEASPGVEAPLGAAGGSDANEGGKKVGERRSARRWARRWARVGGSRVAGRAFTSGVFSRAAREIGARGRRTRARRCWSSIGARSRRCSAAPRRRSSPPPPRGSRRKTRRERRALATRAERAPPGPRGRSRRARARRRVDSNRAGASARRRRRDARDDARGAPGGRAEGLTPNLAAGASRRFFTLAAAEGLGEAPSSSSRGRVPSSLPVDPDFRLASSAMARDVASKLARRPFFDALNAKEFRFLRSRVRRADLAAGHALCRVGEPRDAVFVILSGVLNAYGDDDALSAAAAKPTETTADDDRATTTTTRGANTAAAGSSRAPAPTRVKLGELPPGAVAGELAAFRLAAFAAGVSGSGGVASANARFSATLAASHPGASALRVPLDALAAIVGARPELADAAEDAAERGWYDATSENGRAYRV